MTKDKILTPDARVKLLELIDANGGSLPPGIMANTLAYMVVSGELETTYRKNETWQTNAVTFVRGKK